MEPDLADIDLINKLKTAFIRERSKKYSNAKYSRQDAKLNDVRSWDKVLSTIKRIKADPEDYIIAQFRYSKSIPLLNTLHGPKAIERYKQLNYAAGNAGMTKVNDTAPDVSESTLSVAAKALVERLIYLQTYLAWQKIDPDNMIAVVNYLTDIPPGIIDPVAAVIQYPVAPVKDYYGESAIEEYEDDPGIKRAMLELGFDAILPYFENDEQ